MKQGVERRQEKSVIGMSAKMPSTYIVVLFGILSLSAASAPGSKCPEIEISRLVVCYYKSEAPLGNLNICNCTHLVFENAVERTHNHSLQISEDAEKDLLAAKEKKANLHTLFTLTTNAGNSSAVSKGGNGSREVIEGIARLLRESPFDGVELNLLFNSHDGVSKQSYASFVKDLSETLSDRRSRLKREGYSVFETVQDDVTTTAYSAQSPKNGTSERPPLRPAAPAQGDRPARDNDGRGADDAHPFLPPEAAAEKKEESDVAADEKPLIFVRLSIRPEIIAKKFDLKGLSRYADILTVPTHDITNEKENENRLTYHPSRLMGLADILNTDSILDFLTGMGALKSKIVVSMPATVLEFTLDDEHKNTPASPASRPPQLIPRSKLCSLFSKNKWTLERDDDLTAPYAFSGKTWLAFEDEISVGIKGKYILLRELAGGAIYPIDADADDESCSNGTGSAGRLTSVLYGNFRNLGRKPRALVLESLQEEIRETGISGSEAGVKLSEYRIVRVVDNSGAVHVIRKNSKTEFECSRQGYFSHPSGCNRFYRCVKFDQYSDEFTVFEYECPAGLAFDERWEVCVWPGSLPHGAPCTGSSEIAPVPRSRYRCPDREGYYADPENCRWFFACLDHARDAVTPLTAYEFRCPFGLVFSEEKLACDWPWLVGGCGGAGAGAAGLGLASASHTLTFINGGNLEASFGQYGGNFQEEASPGNSAKGFGKVEAIGSHRGVKSAGFGYIAGQYDDDDDNGRASFASLPDYEISGGRIFNKAGVVLKQNFNSVGASDENFHGGNEQVPKGDRYGEKGETFSAQNINIHRKTSEDLTDRVAILGHISTPKPFSVEIPSVQINEERISGYSPHLIVGSTTPRLQQDFSATLSPVPSARPTPQSVPATVGFSYGTSPEVRLHGFEQADFEGNSFSEQVSDSRGASIGAALVPGGEQVSGGAGSVVAKEALSFAPLKPGLQNFGSSRNGGLVVAQSTSQSGLTGEAKEFATPATLGFGRKEENLISGGRPAASFAVPSKPEIQSVEFASSGGSANSFVSFTSRGQESGFTVATPKTSGESAASFSVSTSKPSVYAFQQTGTKSGVSFPPTIATRPATRAFEQTTIDQEIYRELNLKKPINSYGFPVVTPKTGIFSIETTKSGFRGSATATQSVVPATTESEIHGFSQKNAQEKLLSAVAPGRQVSFEVTEGTWKANPSTFGRQQSIGSPTAASVTPNPFADARGQSFGGFSGATDIAGKPDFGQKVHFRDGGDGPFFNVPLVLSKTKTHSIDQFAAQSPSASSSSYPSNFDRLAPVKPLASQSPKPEFFAQQTGVVPPKEAVTHVSVEQQPIISIGAVSSINSPRPTQKPFTTAAFTSGPAVTNFQATYLQPERPTTSTTTAPIASQNFFYQYSPRPLDENFFSKTSQSVIYKQQQPDVQPIRTEIVSPGPSIQGTYDKSATFDQNNISFQQEVKSFTSSRPLVHQQKIVSAVNDFPEQSDSYLSSFTPQIPPSSTSYGKYFGGVGNEELVPRVPISSVADKNFEFISSETVAPQKVDHVRVPIDQSTVEPALQKRPSTGHPFLAGKQLLHFSKSVQVNPSRFFESTKTYLAPSQATTTTPLLVRQQPVSLIPPKTFRGNEVVVPFYEGETFSKEKDVTHVQKNTILEGGLQDQLPNYGFQQVVGQLKTPETTAFEKNQHIQPAVTEKDGYASLVVTPKAYFPPAVSPKTDPPSPISQRVYEPPTSSETYHSPAVTPKTYVLSEARGFSTSETHISSVPPLKTYLQPSVTGQAYEPPAANPKAYLFPAVTPKVYAIPAGAPKTPLPPSSYTSSASLIRQPIVYPEQNENVTPVPVQKEAILSRTQARDHLPSSFGVSVTPQINLLSPSTTPIPSDHFSPLTEEISIQRHSNFEFQKLKKEGAAFIPSTTESPVSFARPASFLSDDAPHFGFGANYPINLKINIPEPPEGYFLPRNSYATKRPSSARVSGSESTADDGEGSHLPPQLTTPKATLISSDDRRDNGRRPFDEYSGTFGQVIGDEGFGSKVAEGDEKGEFGREGSSTVRYEVSSSRQRGRGRQYHGSLTSSAIPATNKYEEYEIEKGNQRSLDYGKEGESSKTNLDVGSNELDKNKKTVIVVSQVSDANPILVGKLAGQCSCQSNMLQLKTTANNSGRRRNQNSRGRQDTVLIGGGKRLSYRTDQSLISSTTASYPQTDFSPSLLSSLGTDGVLPITPRSLFAEAKLDDKKKRFRGRTRYLPAASDFGDKFLGEALLLSPVPASEIASTVDYAVLKADESRAQNEIEGGRAKASPGAAFDRYGPGGWRAFDETLQGSVDCKRPGLFRHPKHCNKFYACNYDPWKERFTLHVFNCPIQLTYDSSISACNWPIRGPNCADDNLLV